MSKWKDELEKLNLTNNKIALLFCFKKLDEYEEKIKEMGKTANNAVYFADNSDYKTALYEILIKSEIIEDLEKLKYIE